MDQDQTVVARTRRHIIGSVGALTGAALLPGLSGGAALARAASPSWTPGLQLYTLGDAPKTDLEGTLRQVARIGYREVELPGPYGRKPAELRQAIRNAGLRCPAVHVVPPATPGAWHLDGDIAALAADIRAVGASRAVVAIAPFPERVREVLAHPPAGGYDMDALDKLVRTLTADDWKRAADLLNDRATRLAKSGVGLAYHNHAFEFLPLAGGGTGYDLLLARTDPALVSFEMDLGWVVAAGQDVVELLTRAGRRVTMMHMKDVAAVSKNIMEMTPADVGAGIVPWEALKGLIRRFDIQHLFVEQEPPFPNSPFASVNTAFTYLSDLFAKRR